MDNVRHMPREQADQDGLSYSSPHDAEAEHWMAGVIMHDRTAYLECAQVLDRDDIYLPAVRLIWDVVGGMVAENKQLHPITVKAEIEKLKRLGEVGGGALLLKLGSDTIPGVMAQAFAERIAEKARVRRHDEHANRVKAEILRGATGDDLDKLNTEHRHLEERRATTGHGPSHLTNSFVDWDPFFATDFGAIKLLPGRLLAPGQQITIVGDGKAGKSLFVQEWLWRMASGRDFLGDPAADPIPLLYVDAENGHQDIQERFLSFGAGPGRMGLMTYASFPPIRPLDTAGGGADLMAMVKESEAQLVCLDTVSRFISGPENEADTWLNLYRHTLLPLKRAGLASVRLDHLGKDSERGARGSSAKTQDVDHVWELRAQGGGQLHLKRTHTRTGIGPEQFSLLRQARRDGDHYQPGGTRHVLMTHAAEPGADTGMAAIPGTVEHIVAALDRAGVPNDAGNRVARATLAELQIQAGSGKIADAVRLRKARSEKPGFDVSPERFPEAFQQTFPGNVSRNASQDGNAAGQTFPGNVRETPGTPPVPPGPPSKGGTGVGTQESQSPQTPLCTVCEHPLHGYRLDRGYDTCLGCDPETGSHPDRPQHPDTDQKRHSA
ncbi:AAA family ATPase [Streptomyces sp. NPDC001781]